MKAFPALRSGTTMATLMAVALPLLMLALVIAGTGSYVYVSARMAATRTVADDMAAVTRLKSGQIQHWVQERTADAEVLTSRFSGDLERWVQSGMRSDRLEGRLLEHLRHFAAAARYPDISLHSADDGRLLLSSAGRFDLPALREQAKRIAALGRPMVEDFDAAGEGDRREMQIGFFSPVFGTDGKRALGVLHVNIDPSDAIFSLVLQQWPVASRSAEVLLLRKEGDHVRYIDTGHPRDRMLELRQPLSTPRSIAARVILEGEGFFEGDDYRGVPSFAYGLRVADSPWYLVANVSREEAFAQLHRVTNLSAILLFVLLSLSAWWLVYRNRMEDTLRASLAESEDLYQNAPCGYHSLDSDGTFIHINDTELRLLGYAREEIVGRKRLQDLLAPQALSRFDLIFPRFKQTGWAKDVELDLVRKDGSIVPVLISASAVCDAEGRYLMCRCTVVDITERKRIEGNHATLNRALRLLSQCNSVLVHAPEEQALLDSICRLIVDVGGYRMAWVGFAERDAAKSIRAVSRHGRDAGYLETICVSWADDERGQGPTGMAIRTGTTQINRDFRDNPHTSLWREEALARGYLSSIALPLADKHGVFGALAIYADMTDVFGDEEVALLEELADNLSFGIFALRSGIARRQAEDSLRKLSRAVEQSPESIVITDVRTTIEYVNNAFVDISGYSREEAIGRNPGFLRSGNTPPETYAALWATLRQGKAWKGEFHNRRKDGSEYVEFAIVAPIRQPDGVVTHYLALKEDITEKKRLGLELDRHRHHLEELVTQRTAELALAKAAAESANVAKSAFLANMSHEIRTPMNAIIGLTRQLRKDATPRQVERLGKIDTAAGHLLSIINDILDFSKIEAGKLVLEKTDFPLSAILDEVRTLIAEPAEEKGLAIDADHGDVPAWLRGDPTRLRQALLNFAGNAVKFTERGSIRLSARLLEDRGGDVMVRFAVEDSGIGIAADQLPHLFQPFHQADATTTRRFGGTGLGLAISQRLAALMGGEAGVASRPGIGSTFWFTARLGRGHSTQSPAYAIDAKSILRNEHASAYLLLVEDDPLNQEIALELLAEAGLNTDIAADGLQAVTKAAAVAYDLILMDMQMPGMDGIDATRAIRSLPERVATPIIAITANAFDEDRQRCLDAGMSDFVAKPLNPDIVFSTLLKWLSPAAPGAQAAPAAHGADVGPSSFELRQRLGRVAGLDIERVLKGMPARLSSYTRLLSQYVQNYRNVGHVLARHVVAGDADKAAHIAHSLKGSAGFLGMARVQALAGEVESLCRAQRLREEIDGVLAELEAEQAAMMSALEEALSGSPPRAPPRKAD